MGSVNSDAHKDDDSELEDSFSIDEIRSGENGLLKSGNLLSQKRQQCSLVSNGGKWLQIVKNGPKGSFSRATSFFDNRIPRQLVSLDEKYLRRCLDLINISAFKSASCSLSMNLVAGSTMGISSSYFDSPVIAKENVSRILFDLPLVDDSGSIVISPSITGCKRVTHMLDKPLYLEALDGDDDLNSGTRRADNSGKGLVSCGVLSRIDEKCTPNFQFQSYESGKMSRKAVSLSSTNSMSSTSSEHSSSCWSPSPTISQGTLQFTMKDNKTPHFVFSLDDQKETYVASLSTSSVGSGFDRSTLDYYYLIHLKKARGSEPQHLVGKLKVSTSFSISSGNEKTVERQFVLFSSGGSPQLLCHNGIKKSRGLPKKVVDALKATTRASRQRSISRFSRTSSIPEICSWEPFQEPDHDLEPVSLLDNDLPPNLETLAVVVREQFPEEEEEEQEKVGGWGMKFLKKTPLARKKNASENSKHSTSIDVVIPAGIHGGPRKRNGGPSSLVERWKSGGSCDCSGWDLGCPLTISKGQTRKDQNESQCNLFELLTEGSKQEIPGLRVMNVRDGLYFVQFQAELSVLQSFSIALAYIHSQSQRLRPWLSGKCTKKLN